jgi:hypothetical protein
MLDRPVDFREDVEAHGDATPMRWRSKAGVVELVERQAVVNDRLAQGMAVGEDVGGCR